MPPSTELVDLDGAAVDAGIIDSHLHPFAGARQARGADLMGAHTIEEVRASSRRSARGARPHEWVLGFGLDYNVFGETDIHAGLIDDAVDGAPPPHVRRHARRPCSTRTLELAGITGAREFSEHAEVVVDADGRPTGQLRERGALDLARNAMPELTARGRLRLCADQLKRFAAHRDHRRARDGR